MNNIPHYLQDRRLSKIDDVRFHGDSLRYLLPYQVFINKVNNTFYTLNRNYRPLGMLRSDKPDDYYEGIYLYNDGTKPFKGAYHWKNYIKKYLELTKNMTKINKRGLIDIILELKQYSYGYKEQTLFKFTKSQSL